eukprot:scaffold87255_cov22-Tisochrysis_lutea.AAC.1
MGCFNTCCIRPLSCTLRSADAWERHATQRVVLVMARRVFALAGIWGTLRTHKEAHTAEVLPSCCVQLCVRVC